MKKGTLRSVSGNTLEVADDDGNTASHSVAPNATVTLDGKKATLADLKAGDSVTLTGDPATSVTATR